MQSLCFSPLNRRQFLRRAATAAALPIVVPGSVLGLNGAVAPSNRIVFGGIGIGNRARAILPNFLSFKEIHFRAVSDCREERLKSAKELVDRHYGNPDCLAQPDFRELLARADVDAVLIATGNRWHGLGSIYAARAGKDIYCEKPVSLTIAEGRKLVETCRRYGTIYQAGTQRRSTASYRFAREMVRQGKIGRLRTVEMQVWTGPAIPQEKAVAVPPGWNYDIWLGQTPWHPFVPGRVNSWQYFWDTADGIIADMGCHYTDQMQWALGADDTGPVEFEAQGEFPDPAKFCSDAPLTGAGRCGYANGVAGVMYQRGEFKDRYLRFIGDEGWIQVDDETDVVTAEPKSILSLKDTGGAGWGDASGHVRNLLQCIRSRTPAMCQPEVAHRAMTICQAWSISLRLGRKLRWDPVTERFDSEEANRMLYREPRAPWRA
ncbi:MAG TPA: Gfo/Idh/MocA family oxidoreductase [Candidatus Binatia bacterium]|jgi:predicted dehydrogenase|nr:Gfo/Idh/MocA family oxidoreductase [Candidatus Binatia bacterium]